MTRSSGAAGVSVTRNAAIGTSARASSGSATPGSTTTGATAEKNKPSYRGNASRASPSAPATTSATFAKGYS